MDSVAVKLAKLGKIGKQGPVPALDCNCPFRVCNGNGKPLTDFLSLRRRQFGSTAPAAGTVAIVVTGGWAHPDANVPIRLTIVHLPLDVGSVPKVPALAGTGHDFSPIRRVPGGCLFG